jgi:hypothetical protein
LIALLIMLSILFTFSSRPQVGWVLVFTLLIHSLFGIKNSLTYGLIFSVLAGLFAAYLATTSFVYIQNDTYAAKKAISMPANDSSLTSTNRQEISASKLCDETKTKINYEGEIYNCMYVGTVTKRERRSSLFEVAKDQIEILPGKQIVNQVGAASKITRLECPWEETSEIGKYSCLGFRAPYMTLTFLLRPLPFIDITSQSSIFAAGENTLWIFMYMLIFYRIFKLKRIPFFKELSPSIIFFCFYVVGAGSYEGNMGTAFRHKSLILWIILLILFFLFWRNPDEAKEPQRNNSQETAV